MPFPHFEKSDIEPTHVHDEGSDLDVSQTRTRPSFSRVASVDPRQDKELCHSSARKPSNSRTHAPVTHDHTRTVLSHDAETRNDCDVVKDDTKEVCPRRV